MTTNTYASTGVTNLKRLMEQHDHASAFDLHDAYAVGVRQAVAVLLRTVDVLTPLGLDMLLPQFHAQRRDPVCLLALTPRISYAVREEPMCLMYPMNSALIRQGVECGRLLVLSLLTESLVQNTRRLTELDIHEVGMRAYAWLMDLAAQQLHDDEYEVWHNYWCQIPGRMPWNLTEHAQEVDIAIMGVQIFM